MTRTWRLFWSASAPEMSPTTQRYRVGRVLPIGNMGRATLYQMILNRKERAMGRLTVEPAARADGRMGEFVEAFARRVEAQPPGQCPVGMMLGQLQTSMVQTCGKCTPCAQGMPKIAALLRDVAELRATEATVGEIRVKATLLRDTADCAVGWQAGQMVLAGLDAFADEFASHVEAGQCAPRHAPDGALRHPVPGPCERAGLHRAGRGGTRRRGREDDPQGQPVPDGLRAGVRASVRGALPPHHSGRAREHSRHQEVHRGHGGRRHGGDPSAAAGDGQARCRGGRRSLWPHLCLLPGPDGPRSGGVRGAPRSSAA